MLPSLPPKSLCHKAYIKCDVCSNQSNQLVCTLRYCKLTSMVEPYFLNSRKDYPLFTSSPQFFSTTDRIWLRRCVRRRGHASAFHCVPGITLPPGDTKLLLCFLLSLYFISDALALPGTRRGFVRRWIVGLLARRAPVDRGRRNKQTIPRSTKAALRGS